MLKLLPIFFYIWTDVTLDFITGWLIGNGYKAMLVGVDCLTKKGHYILCTIDKNGTITEATAQLLF